MFESRLQRGLRQELGRGGLLYPALRMVAIVMAVGGVIAAAQEAASYPVFTQAKFVSAMKAAGLNSAAANHSLEGRDYEAAKAQLIRSREQIATTISFWRDRKNPDGVNLVRAAVRSLDAADIALSKETVDPATVNALVKDVGAACEACHRAFREQDPATKAYRFKPGVAQ